MVNSKKRQTKNIDAVQIMKKKESFIGEECLKLLDGFPVLLNHIFDELRGGAAPEEKDRAYKAWAAYREVGVSNDQPTWGEWKQNNPSCC